MPPCTPEFNGSAQGAFTHYIAAKKIARSGSPDRAKVKWGLCALCLSGKSETEREHSYSIQSTLHSSTGNPATSAEPLCSQW